MARACRDETHPALFCDRWRAAQASTAWTFGLDAESSYDWENEQWSVPVNVSASKVTRFGSQLVSVGGGLRYWLDDPDVGAEGLGLRFTVPPLFPR